MNTDGTDSWLDTKYRMSLNVGCFLGMSNCLFSKGLLGDVATCRYLPIGLPFRQHLRRLTGINQDKVNHLDRA